MSQCLLYILMQLLNHVSSGCEVSDILIVCEYNDPANECVCVCVCVCVHVLCRCFIFSCCHDFHYFVFVTALWFCLIINKSQYTK